MDGPAGQQAKRQRYRARVSSPPSSRQGLVGWWSGDRLADRPSPFVRVFCFIVIDDDDRALSLSTTSVSNYRLIDLVGLICHAACVAKTFPFSPFRILLFSKRRVRY
jgi:hypothetical protein